MFTKFILLTLFAKIQLFFVFTKQCPFFLYPVLFTNKRERNNRFYSLEQP